MFKNRFPGKFIAIEGLGISDFGGQLQEIKKYLKKEKKSVWLTAEPTKSVIGGIIRSSLSGDWKMDSATGLQLLFAADRANHLAKDIIPRLKKDINVITDRYFLSAIAYGSIGISDQDWLFKINDQFLLPDLIILIKMSAKTVAERLKTEDEAIVISTDQEELQQVWRTYENISKKYPNIKIIDGEQEEEEVFEEILKEIRKVVK